jgi:predicted nucleic acid-binding protein
VRLLDTDILAYSLYDQSPAHPYAWPLVEKATRGDLHVKVTHTTMLETYNTLYWFYRVRPRKAVLQKLALAVRALHVVDTAAEGIGLAAKENIPLGDGFLISTALKHQIPVVVSGDAHILANAPKYGLMVENPIPAKVRKELVRPA